MDRRSIMRQETPKRGLRAVRDSGTPIQNLSTPPTSGGRKVVTFRLNPNSVERGPASTELSTPIHKRPFVLNDTPAHKMRPNAPRRAPLRVFLRVRPVHVGGTSKTAKGDASDVPDSCITIVDDTSVILRAPKDARVTHNAYRTRGETDDRFTFSRVFSPRATQRSLFDRCARPMVDAVMSGTNSLLFAYGITGSGKTYTIEGERDDAGILPRTLEYLFHCLRHAQPIQGEKKSSNASSRVSDASRTISALRESTIALRRMSGIQDPEEEEQNEIDQGEDDNQAEGQGNWKAFVTYYEVYNEQVYDLLAVGGQISQGSSPDVGPGVRLRLREDHGKVTIPGLRFVEVNGAREAKKLLRAGRANRKVAATLLNRDSSRSHAIVSVRVVQQQRAAPTSKSEPDVVEEIECTLSLVDLAGSERAEKTQNRGVQLKESANINTSLMTLGRCIEAMKFNQSHPDAPQRMVPFRESKLTRLFQEHLTGRGRCAMIVTARQNTDAYFETLNTLKFSALARDITTNSASVDARLVSLGNPQQQSKSNGDMESMDSANDVQMTDPCAGCGNCEELSMQVDALQEKVVELEAVASRLELKLREEIVAETQDQLQRMEAEYNSRVNEITMREEEKFRRKFDLVRSQDAGNSSPRANGLSLLTSTPQRPRVEGAFLNAMSTDPRALNDAYQRLQREHLQQMATFKQIEEENDKLEEKCIRQEDENRLLDQKVIRLESELARMQEKEMNLEQQLAMIENSMTPSVAHHVADTNAEPRRLQGRKSGRKSRIDWLVANDGEGQTTAKGEDGEALTASRRFSRNPPRDRKSRRSSMLPRKSIRRQSCTLHHTPATTRPELASPLLPVAGIGAEKRFFMDVTDFEEILSSPVVGSQFEGKNRSHRKLGHKLKDAQDLIGSEKASPSPVRKLKEQKRDRTVFTNLGRAFNLSNTPVKRKKKARKGVDTEQMSPNTQAAETAEVSVQQKRPLKLYSKKAANLLRT